MKRIFLIATLLMVGISTFAKDKERHIFEGTSTKYWDIVYTFDGHHIYKGKSTKHWDIIYTYDDKHIYKGDSTKYWDIVYTYDNEHIYKGDSTSPKHFVSSPLNT